MIKVSRRLIETVVHKEVVKCNESFFAQSFRLEDESREVENEWVWALHPANVFVSQFKSNYPVEVYFFTLDRRERISTAEKSKNLFFLLLPRELRNVQVLDESFLVVSWWWNFSSRVNNHVYKLSGQHHSEKLSVKMQAWLPNTKPDSV